MSHRLERDLPSVPDEVVRRIREARHVLAVSHENPDADTIGAALGIVAIAEGLGARGDAACTDPVPPLYAFMPGVDRYRTDPDPDAAYDLLVVLDCGSLDRVGAIGVRHAELFGRLPRVVIDHHASNEPAGAGDWVEPTSAATCEMVALLAARLGIDPRANGLGTNLMAGIVMDTATFAHPNATPRTLEVASWLVAAGAPLSDISRRLYRTKPEAQLRLFGRILDRLQSVDGGRVVWSSVSDRDYAETGADRPHSEGLIDLLSQAEDAEVAILFKQAGPTETRVSVRTRPGGVDATVLTGAFGGGGHARAAGATVIAPLAEAEQTVIAEARRLAALVRR